MDNINNLPQGATLILHKVQVVINGHPVFFEYFRKQGVSDMLDALIFGAIFQEFKEASLYVKQLEVNKNTSADLSQELNGLHSDVIHINIGTMLNLNEMTSQDFEYCAENLTIEIFSSSEEALKEVSLRTYDNKIYNWDVLQIRDRLDNTFYVL